MAERGDDDARRAHEDVFYDFARDERVEPFAIEEADRDEIEVEVIAAARRARIRIEIEEAIRREEKHLFAGLGGALHVLVDYVLGAVPLVVGQVRRKILRLRTVLFAVSEVHELPIVPVRPS